MCNVADDAFPAQFGVYVSWFRAYGSGFRVEERMCVKYVQRGG
jgi:hypothetical protein